MRIKKNRDKKLDVKLMKFFEKNEKNMSENE